MPTFGFWELTLIMFVALLVVGPDRLPRLAAQAGRWIGRIKRLATNFKEDVAQELHTEDLKNTIAAPQEEFQKLGNELKQTGSQVEREVRRLDPLVKAMDEQIESGRFEPGDDDGPDNPPGNTSSSGNAAPPGDTGAPGNTSLSDNAAPPGDTGSPGSAASSGNTAPISNTDPSGSTAPSGDTDSPGNTGDGKRDENG